MSLTNLQSTRSIFKNQLYFYTLETNNQKWEHENFIYAARQASLSYTLSLIQLNSKQTQPCIYMYLFFLYTSESWQESVVLALSSPDSGGNREYLSNI